jgi:hypothetical protein
MQAMFVTARKRDSDDRTAWQLQRLIAPILPGLAFLGGGLSLIAGGGGGLYRILAATTLAFVVAAINAWVLLVEVLR